MSKFEFKEKVNTGGVDQKVKQPVDEEPVYVEIGELVDPIRDILKQLHERIDNGSYQLLIGGDASGRIPTLIFDKVIKKIYKEKGFDIPRTMSTFIAGGQRYNVDGGNESKVNEIKNRISKYYVGDNLERSEKHGSRVLIIEDTIASGASLQPVTDALKNMGIEFDIATIGFLPTNKKYVEDRLGGEIFYSMQKTPSIYGKSSLSGVVKSRGDLSSEPYMSGRSRKARMDVNEVANELVEWYLSSFN